jgi:non-ribosomal peptide synthetase component F
MEIDSGSLPQRLHESMLRHAGASAVIHDDGVLTYSQLIDRVDAVHAGLPLLADEPVGLVAGRDIATRILYISILLGGGIPVPLNRGWPPDRTGHVLESLGVDHVLGSGGPASVPAGWAPGAAGTWGYEMRRTAARRAPRRVPGPAGDPWAYVLYTSGSTGVPKGVPIRQSAVLAFLDYVVDRYAVGPGARLSSSFDLTFDLAVFDVLAPVVAGAASCLPRGREYFDPAGYAERTGLTHWFSVPSVVSTAAARGALPPASMPSLRWSLFCGEPLLFRQARLWRDAAPTATVENLYGPTELTLACSQYRLPDDVADWPVTANDTVPIGAVYPHLDHRVGSGRDQAELLVRGVQAFDGYIDPDGDAEAIEVDAGGRRWYRTGDRVDVQDGVLVHRGRLDRQVKVSGVRIELDEVEGTYRRAPGVTGAAAVMVGEPGLQALVVLLTGRRDLAAEVDRAVARTLPDYMRPVAVRWLDEFPLNTNRKVDYRELQRLFA